MNESLGGGAEQEQDQQVARCAELEARLGLLQERDVGRERLLAAMNEVSGAVARLRGRPFLDALTARLAATLSADAVLVATLRRRDELAQILSLTLDGRHAPELEKSLAASLYQAVLSAKLLVVRGEIAQTYFDDALIAQMAASSCVGVALQDADGADIGILLALFRHPIEDVPLISALMQFISARAAQELQQERAERRTRALRRLMDSNAVGLVVSDSSGLIVDANDAYLAMIGRNREELARGLRWPDITPPEFAAVDAEALETLRRHGAVGQHEKEYLRKDGTRVPVLLAGAMLDAERERTIAFVLDQTERQRAERERQEALAREQEARQSAQEALRIRDRFMAVLSHELRNPLTPIATAVQLLERLLPVEPRVQNALHMIDRNVHHLARLIEDLLDLARVTRGALQLVRAPLSLGQLVTEAVRVANEDAQRARLRLLMHIDAEAWVDADATRLNQIVMNLLGNAFKFTPAGGSVTVRVEQRDEKACLVVEDTGRGLESELKARLFEPFVQGSDASSQGLGIGLSIVRSIVELHGGRIWAESEGPDRGARFTVELPSIPPPAPELRSDLRHDREASGARVLLVEADDDTRDMLSAGLRLHGHEVLAFASGEEALQLPPSPVPDVMLADIALPGMDGCELLRRLRELPGWGAMPALALTAFGRTEDRQRTRDAGFVEHLVKPVDVGALAHLLRERAVPITEAAREPTA